MAPIQGPGSRIPSVVTQTQSPARSAPTAQTAATARASGSGFTDANSFDTTSVRSGGAGEVDDGGVRQQLQGMWDDAMKELQAPKTPEGKDNKLGKYITKLLPKFEPQAKAIMDDPNMSPQEKADALGKLINKMQGDAMVKQGEAQAFFAMAVKAVTDGAAKIKEAMSR